MNLKAPNPRLFHIDELIARLSARLADEFAMGDASEQQLQDLAAAIEQIELRRHDIQLTTMLAAQAEDFKDHPADGLFTGASDHQADAMAFAFGQIDKSGLGFWNRERADKLLRSIDLNLGKGEPPYNGVQYESLETSESDAVPTPDYKAEAEHLRASLANMTKERDHFREIYLMGRRAPEKWITDPHDMEQGKILNPAWITWNDDQDKRGKPMPPLDVATGSDGQLIPNTMDASAWAAEFSRIFPAVHADDALGWFANALMCGQDAGEAKARKAAEIPFVEFSDAQLQRILDLVPMFSDDKAATHRMRLARSVIQAYRNALMDFKRSDTERFQPIDTAPHQIALALNKLRTDICKLETLGVLDDHVVIPRGIVIDIIDRHRDASREADKYRNAGDQLRATQPTTKA